MAGTVVIEFPSDYKFLNVVDLVCGEVVEGLCCCREEANEIAISVIEACTNAIEHGNRDCPEENVRIVFRCEPGRLVVEVEDHGKGFDFKSYLEHIPDPSDLQHLRGRGIYIMKNMMDALRFETKPGNGIKVTLEKNLREQPPEGGSAEA
ncbi:MAG: ATP-binding protein [Candidatus Latescibacterota bacterium]|jgi:serine/threonine-protein kinase RsbW|nr:MAG: ATP-binding protein [Candidatus Latescibacterota bacterium]